MERCKNCKHLHDYGDECIKITDYITTEHSKMFAFLDDEELEKIRKIVRDEIRKQLGDNRTEEEVWGEDT